jgi:hypothetical protein
VGGTEHVYLVGGVGVAKFGRSTNLARRLAEHAAQGLAVIIRAVEVEDSRSTENELKRRLGDAGLRLTDTEELELPHGGRQELVRNVASTVEIFDQVTADDFPLDVPILQAILDATPAFGQVREWMEQESGTQLVINQSLTVRAFADDPAPVDVDQLLTELDKHRRLRSGWLEARRTGSERERQRYMVESLVHAVHLDELVSGERDPDLARDALSADARFALSLNHDLQQQLRNEESELESSMRELKRKHWNLVDTIRQLLYSMDDETGAVFVSSSTYVIEGVHPPSELLKAIEVHKDKLVDWGWWLSTGNPDLDVEPTIAEPWELEELLAEVDFSFDEARRACVTFAEFRKGITVCSQRRWKLLKLRDRIDSCPDGRLPKELELNWPTAASRDGLMPTELVLDLEEQWKKFLRRPH